MTKRYRQGVMWVTGLFFAVSLLCCSCLSGEEEQKPLTVEQLKEQIKIYENRARFADRQAQRLLTLDYTSYRFYVIMRDENQAIADDLKKKLRELEQEKRESFSLEKRSP